MNNPLLDYEFLNKLMETRQRETYARITLLTQDELPIEYIEGRVTAGSVNVDGNSALRRTCNVTMILKDPKEVNRFHWTFKSKFKLEVGVKNNIDQSYPDIIWFKQGIFILTICNMNQTTNNYTITINGKDKMCLLNGDCGGNIPHSTDFGVEEYLDRETNDVIYTKLLLKDIIKNVVQTFGGERAENIIINDLDQAGLELLEYRGENADGSEMPLYLLRNIKDGMVEQVALANTLQVYKLNSEDSVDISSFANEDYATTSDLFENPSDFVQVTLTVNEGAPIYNIIKFTYGDLAGYRLTDLTYAGELKANVGETLVSVLDKIKKMLSDFEYFYNLDGKFVFQKKHTYISAPWGGVEENKNSSINEALNDAKAKINLTDAKLVTAFANNPNLLNVKNDFSVWGTYKSISGADVPIHMRYAIDIKPTYYKTIRSVWTRKVDDTNAKPPADYNWYNILGLEEVTPGDGYKYSYLTKPFSTIDDGESTIVDWREIIYQMAADYYADSNWTKDDFCLRVANANQHYSFGKTGYEQYYTDIYRYWRDLYNPFPELKYEEINAATVDKNIDYIDGYHVAVDLSWDEKTEKFNYDPNELYIIQEIPIKKDSQLTKKVFYPFIGSKLCCLLENTSYWYYTGKEYRETKEPNILNKRDIRDLFQIDPDDKDKKLSVVTARLKELIANLDSSQSLFWIKKKEKIQIKNLGNDLNTIYQDSQGSFLQYLTRWSIADNFGNLATPESGNPQEINDKLVYLKENLDPNYGNDYWNKVVKEDPSMLSFWFDFLELDESSDLYKYSVRQIGQRTKSINDTNVKSIYYRDVPNVIFIQDLADKTYDRQPGYTYIQLPSGYESLFSISGRGKSAKERVDELLQEHSYAIEQTNITTVPLYHLEPNTRVSVKDEMSNVDGEYVVTKVTVPLTHNGTMSLSTNKVVSNIM